MEERRKNLRTELCAEILVKRLDGATGEKVNIKVTDLSESGVGFVCDAELEKGAVYECFLTIWTKEVIHCFIEVARVQKQEDAYHYGATFIALSKQDASRIQVYQTIEGYKE